MSEQLLQSLVAWSDLQSIVNRTSEIEVVFKSQMARQMHSVALALHRFRVASYLGHLSTPIPINT